MDSTVPFIPSYPSDLPIVEWRSEIVRAIQEHQVLVITGETGSGKSTQIPKFCIEAGRGQKGVIGCTQPRRIAAITLAERVSDELGPNAPRLVGYKIRFQDRTARSTRIKFMTDGILLAEAQRDRLFHAYDTIIVDEAHERSLNIDFLLGILKRTLPRRPDLKVIITSATIDPEKFSSAFGDAPIIEVSGRTYPVEVRYQAAETTEEDNEDTTYIDQAVSAVDSLKGRDRRRGDILIFMPTESDIRETVQRLEEKRYFNTLVLPLFGRLAASDQKRIFAPVSGDKIIVATNVAETSITIPRIRYVIDTGFARIAQYNARSSTRSLPVAPVSQASADQRKGRCGRVEAGICIRLYSESDFLARPLYTPPEIQRSNLAEVILRMLYLKLGRMQDFPFLDPPSPAAVKDGFGVLRELGAVDEHQRLTPTGKMMARLPLDPRISRMLLEAKRENGLAEIIILAAALSIQDPRERPLDQEAQADQAHAVFRDTRSDFVSLLKIWQQCRQEPVPQQAAEAQTPAAGLDKNGSAKKSQEGGGNGRGRQLPAWRSSNQLKKFCRDHFLSHRRVREWRDIYDEIRSILDELGDFPENTEPASYDAIHRSILSGYLSHVALKKEKNVYTAAKGRQAMIFPGSGIFNKGGAWIVASELVQTSRLFARTAANINPEWLEEIGRHLCKYSWSEPHWEKSRGQVTAFEKATLYGLTIVERRKVSFGRINPKEAREIFIRSALVEGELSGRHGFLDHNRELVAKIEELESKTRRRDLLVDSEVLFQFYDERLAEVPEISDLRSFDKLIKDRGGDAFLKMTEKDLLRVEPDFDAIGQFPDGFDANGMQLPLRYAFNPGEDRDGVTLTVPVHALPALRTDPFEWLVPGMLPEKVLLLLKSLPKNLRKHFVPVNETARRISEHILHSGELRGDFYVRLSSVVHELIGVRIPPEQWDRSQLPSHLRMRFEAVGPAGNVLGSGRDLDELRPLTMGRHDDNLWRDSRKIWERENVTNWDFGDLPERIEIGSDALGLPRYAYPGLADESGKVAVRLFTDPERANNSTRSGLMHLYQSIFSAELKQFVKDWIFPEQFASTIFFIGDRKTASIMLHDYILREIFDLQSPQPPDRDRFLKNLERLRGRLGVLGRELLSQVLEVVRERHETRTVLDRFGRMAGGNGAVRERLAVISGEVDSLVPPDFLSRCSGNQMSMIPRYLKALRIRAERAYVAPEKDKAKELQYAPYKAKLAEIEKQIRARPGEHGPAYLNDLAGMIEEFKISLFAPEIRTLFPISSKRIENKLRELPM